MFKFDDLINRKDTASVKYEELDSNFGKDDLIPLWVADMDLKSPDFLIEALKERADHGIYGYTKRMDGYYDNVISWLDRRHNFKVSKEELEYGPGVVFLLNMMIRLFTEENDKIIIQTPVYYPFYSVIEGNNRQISKNPLVDNNGRYEMDFEDLEKKASDPDCSMLILCSPHNPVGRVWTKEELTKLGEICLKHDVLVVSDEIHFDLVFEPNVHIPFASISDEFRMNSITCTAPSKTFNIAGLHSAYCIISDSDMMDAYIAERGLLDLNRSNVFSSTATEVLYEQGDEWLDNLLVYLEENIEFINDYISENIPNIKVRDMEGTYLLWLDCSELNLSQEELEKLFVEDAKIALDSGKWFGDEGEGFMRLNIASSRELLKQALKQLKEAVDNL